MNNYHFILDSNLSSKINLAFKFKLQKPSSHYKLRNYTTFRSITIDEINCLRSMLFLEKEINNSWNEKILKFLEIRLSELDYRMKKNYNYKTSRLIFKEVIISFLLENFYYKNDIRFLNTALKIIMRTNKTHHKQYKYNRTLCGYLLEKI